MEIPKDEAEFVAMLHKWRDSARKGQEDYGKRAAKARRFWRGDQWEKNERLKLQREKKPWLTLNMCLAITNSLSGMQRQNPLDITAFPKRSGTRGAARILTALAKQAEDASGGRYQYSEAFKNGAISGKGWLHLDIVYDDEPGTGDLIITAVPGRDILEDPRGVSEYGLNAPGGSRYLIHRRWTDKDEVHARWPGKETALTDQAGTAGDKSVLERLKDRVSEIAGSIVGFNQEDEDLLASEEASLTEAMQEYRYPVDWYWFREPYAVYFYRDNVEGKTLRLTESKAIARAKRSVKEMPNRFQGRSIVAWKLHRALLVGSVLLERTEDPLRGVTVLPYARFSPFWDAGHVFGLVETLQDPQTEHNKRRSQVLHHLNSSANSGWQSEKGAIAVGDMKVYESFGSTPGVVLEHTKGSRPPTQILPQPLSEGHFRLGQVAINDMREISGVNTELLGQEAKSGMSGKAMQLQQRQGMLVVEIIFDNFARTRQEFGKLLIDVVQRSGVYSQDEIEQIVDTGELVDRELMQEAAKKVAIKPPAPPPPPDPLVLQAVEPLDATEVVGEYQRAMKLYQAEMQKYMELLAKTARDILMAQVTDLSVGKYGVKVADSPMSQTTRHAKLQELLQVAEAYPNTIPPDAVIEATDLPNKTELAERVRQNMAQAAQGAGGG